MRLLDSRRLTGASIFLDCPGAVIDIAAEDDERELLAAAWTRHARRLLSELDWPNRVAVRFFEGGVNLALAAPVDGLYTATEVNEAAWEAARDWIEGTQRNLLQRVARALRSEYRDEERPRLQKLIAEAQERGTPIQLDDDLLTLGQGHASEAWDLYELPHPEDVDWSTLKRIPTVLVTGTNGKTTTVRLLAAIGRAWGKTTGVSSTDWLAMGDELVSRDDFAGPAGARQVLRDKRCQLAILETARGGLLRRGLAVAQADVALITNVAADHLGDYGIETVEDLADTKWSVTQALNQSGSLVLNADDDRLMARMVGASPQITLFSLSPKNPLLLRHVAAGGVGFTVQRRKLVKLTGSKVDAVTTLSRIPVTYDGAARHNIANALAAAGVADALGIPTDVIASGLANLRNEDNPGRANVYDVGGVTVLLDFAHNPAGLEALMPVVNKLPAKRRLLITGQAGDRGDEDLRAFAHAIGDTRFDRIIIKRMDGHARGREFGEVAGIMRQAFSERGYPAKSLGSAKTELDAVRAALRWAKPGDLVLLLSHEKREETRLLVEKMASKAAAE